MENDPEGEGQPKRRRLESGRRDECESERHQHQHQQQQQENSPSAMIRASLGAPMNFAGANLGGGMGNQADQGVGQDFFTSFLRRQALLGGNAAAAAAAGSAPAAFGFGLAGFHHPHQPAAVAAAEHQQNQQQQRFLLAQLQLEKEILERRIAYQQQLLNQSQQPPASGAPAPADEPGRIANTIGASGLVSLSNLQQSMSDPPGTRPDEFQRRDLLDQLSSFGSQHRLQQQPNNNNAMGALGAAAGSLGSIAGLTNTAAASGGSSSSTLELIQALLAREPHLSAQLFRTATSAGAGAAAGAQFPPEPQFPPPQRGNEPQGVLSLARRDQPAAAAAAAALEPQAADRQQPEQQEGAAVPALVLRGPTGRPPTPLFRACDAEDLSEYQCYIRKQIEAFEAAQQDLDTNARGRNRPIVRGQVGIRCRHCTIVPPQHRQRAAIYYPSKLDRLYQMSQTIASIHLLEQCQHIPTEVRNELLRLRQIKSAALGGKKYWADAGRALGLIECDKRLFFVTNHKAGSTATHTSTSNKKKASNKR